MRKPSPSHTLGPREQRSADAVLANKPLVETILELKWMLSPSQAGALQDPHYRLLLGRLYDRVSESYPEHEQLPTAVVPDELVGHIVQHRFRAGTNDWPLIQLGPGILTLNDTDKYIWEDFRTRSLKAVNTLFQAHPKQSDLRITNVQLRYIDAIDFDYSAQDVFGFLKEKMKVVLALPDNLFCDGTISREPAAFVWQSSFRCNSPASIVSIKFASGHRDGKPALLWETIVESQEKDVPSMPAGFETWVDQAHQITHDWFFKLIEGDLERRFRNE